MFDIKEELKKLPDSPGVYLHKDEFGQIIYVGKAISLKKRVSQYFQSSRNHSPKTVDMVKHIKEFEYINCGSEMEALILECNLIKKYKPKYNILLRDDKTYPYIKVTLNEDFPRVIKTRRLVNDGSKYFGPYADVTSVNIIIDLLNSMYALKRCKTLSFNKSFKPCLNYHIHQCQGLCTGNVTREEYKVSVDKALEFLSGKTGELVRLIKDEMNAASDEERYEDAAIYRDYLYAIEALSEKQRVVLSSPENIDVVLVEEGFSGCHALLFTVREGKLSGRESFFLGDGIKEDKDILLSEFIKRYYFENVMIPKQILVSSNPADKELLEEYLSRERGSNVSITLPQRGEKKALLDVIRRDALLMLSNLDERANRQIEKNEKVYEGLKEIFGEDAKKIHRVESYDISNIFGVDSVGAMVVFEDGVPLKKAYRRFKIKTIEGANDVGSLTEVLFRRFRNAVSGMPGFEILPDAIFMDGGEGQIGSAKDVLNALGLTDIIVCGMVKDDKHRTRAILYNGEEYPLRGKPELFSYVGAIQEEVHRFAIDYHRNLRNKSVQVSVLDKIPGVGPGRKADLLSKFGSVEAIKNASIVEISSVVPESVAREIKRFFEA